MIKIGHVSDTHLGYKMYNKSTRKTDFYSAFEEAIDYFIDENVDIVIHTGDLFHSNSPSTPTLKGFTSLLRRLEGEGIRFYGIVGNHEKRRDMEWLEYFEGYLNCDKLGDYPVQVSSDGIDLSIFGIDKINREDWSKEINISEDSEADYNIVASHELLSPPVREKISDHKLKDFIEKIGFKPDLILSGDYHQYQEHDVEDMKVLYSGSTENTSFNSGSEKFVSIVELGDTINVKQKKLDTRPFLEFELGEIENRDQLVSELSPLLEDYGKKPVLKLNIDSEINKISRTEIKRICEDLGFLTCRINNIGEYEEEEIDMEELGDIKDRTIKKLEKMKASKETEEIVNVCFKDGISQEEIRDETNEILDD